MTLIDYADSTPDVAFGYDRLGRQQTVDDAFGSRTFIYNTDLQLQGETLAGLYEATISRSYDTVDVPGRATGFAIGPDYNVVYDYDTKGRFNTVDWQANGRSDTVIYTYLPDAELVEGFSTASGSLANYAYEPHRNLRTQISNFTNAQLVSQYDYVYDKIGRRTSVANSGQAFSLHGFNRYDYNDRNELIGSDRYLGNSLADLSQPVNEQQQGYDYDNIGNRENATLWDDAAAMQEQLTYTANQLNQYELIDSDLAPPKTPAYDDDGNMTGYKESKYTYNAENRLIVAEPQSPTEGDSRVENVYDYMGRRVQKKMFVFSVGIWQPATVHFYLYDGWNLIQEIATDSQTLQSTTRYFVWGLDVSQRLQGAGGVGGLLTLVDDTSSYSCFFDGNGNVGQLVDGTGAIAAHYEYDPYGNLVNVVGSLAATNPFRFSTKYFDVETNLYYYGNRFYSPELGRWLTKDPIGEEGGLNLYGFISNTPINHIDFLGLLNPNLPEYHKNDFSFKVSGSIGFGGKLSVGITRECAEHCCKSGPKAGKMEKITEWNFKPSVGAHVGLNLGVSLLGANFDVGFVGPGVSVDFANVTAVWDNCKEPPTDSTTLTLINTKISPTVQNYEVGIGGFGKIKGNAHVWIDFKTQVKFHHSGIDLHGGVFLDYDMSAKAYWMTKEYSLLELNRGHSPMSWSDTMQIANW